MSGTSFNLTWNAVTTSADGSAAYDLDHYEIKVESTGTATTLNYLSNDTKFELSLEKNRNLFGAPRANIKMSVRAVDKVGNASAYSSVIDQTNAAPANPTGFTGIPSVDTLNFKWTAVADTDLMMYRIYSGTTVGSQTTLAWSGLATNATVQSTDYATDRWYKVVAVDVFGTESAAGPVVGPIKPTSSTSTDVTAPAVPAGLTATLTTAADTTTSAQVSWTAVTDTDGDLAGYRIGYRPVGATDWSYTDVDYTLTSTRIDRLTPYVNYEFRIRSYDWSANFSAWSATFTTNTAATNTAPAASTGVTASAAYGTVIVSWTEATENDVKFGAGMYDVQLDTSTAFNTGNLRTLRTSATVASFSNVAAGTWYTRVRAVDSLGLAGAWSGNVTVVQNDTVATNAYIASRGTDLVTNGTGLLGTNYNFSPFTFDKVDAPAGTGGSFKSPATMGTLFSDEFIPLDPSKKYKFSISAKQTGTATTAYAYTGLAPYDINKYSIAPSNYMYQNNTTTTLAADLKPGDTVMYLTSAANWNNAAGASTHLRGIIVWNYVDQNGKDWGERSYSRDAKLNIYADGAVDTTANTVTLSAPWVGFTNTSNGESGRTTIPAGTPISNSSSGSGYMYVAIANTNIPQAWTSYSGLINGFMTYGTSLTAQVAASDKFPPGTAFAKLLFLTNRSTTGGGAYATGSFHSFAAISLSDASYAQTTADGKTTTFVSATAPTATAVGDIWIDTANGNVIKIATAVGNASWVNRQDAAIGTAQTAATNAQTTANGKNKVTYSQAAPGTTANTAGDIWFQLGDGVSVSSGQIIAQFSGGGGTTWFAKTLNNQVIATLDAGKITTGTLDVANRIAAGSIDASKIVADSITAGQIATGTITSTEIATNTITASNMVAGTITAASGIIADAAIVNAKIANVSADKLIANTSFINDLNVKSKFTLGDAATDGNIESYDYGTSGGTTGFKLAKSGLIIKTGAIEAAALKIQAGANMIPAEYSSFEFVPTFYLTRLPTTGATVSKTTITTGGKVGPQYLQARSTSAASFILYLGLSTTDYNIYVDAGVTYIVSAWVKTGTVASSVSLKAYYDNATNSGNVGTTALSASGAWQRISGVVTVPAGVGKMLLAVDVSTATSGAGFDIDGIQVEQKIGSINTPSTWTMPGSTSIDGGILRTGEIRSNTNVAVNGVQQPAWSVNMSGNAQFGDAAVRGKLVVGTGTMVNLVPGNGTFESGSAMNWFVYDGTATGTAINLTTVAGEVIYGTYSGKSIASPVANNELGLYFDVADIPPGATVHITGTVKGDYPGTHIRVGIGDLSTGTYQFIMEDVYKYMLADTPVTFDRTFTMPVGYTGKRIFIYLVNGMTSTFIIDNVSAYVDSELSASYAASGNFQQGVQGWKIDSSGNAEFNNGTFRGTLSASTMIGDNIVGGRVISGPINGTHAEMTSAGFKAFVEDPLDGVPNEVVRIGTEGNDTIGISDASGTTLASIDETGRGLFKAISVGEDAPVWTTDPVDGNTYLSSGLEIYGKEFNQYINGLARGVVSSGYLGSAWTPPALNTQGEVGIGEISFIQEGETADTLRSYRVVFNGAMGSATTSRIGVIYRLRYTNNGASPAVTTSTIADSVITQIDTIGEAVAIPPMIVQSAWTTVPGAVIRVLLTAQRYYGTGSWNINTYAGGGTFKPLRLYVEDVGLDVPDTWITNYGGNDFSGGAPAAPSVKKTYTATWSSTAGYTYRGDGVRRTDTSDVVQGYSSYATINGNGKGLWLFPTSIATTLSGATVNKVEVYAYANHWYANAGGTAMIKVHGYTTMPASSPTLTAATSSAGWPKPGGRWVTLPSSFNAGFQNGTYRGFGMGPGTSTSSTYYGRFNGGTAAKIRITYTK